MTGTTSTVRSDAGVRGAPHCVPSCIFHLICARTTMVPRSQRLAIDCQVVGLSKTIRSCSPRSRSNRRCSSAF